MRPGLVDFISTTWPTFFHQDCRLIQRASYRGKRERGEEKERNRESRDTRTGYSSPLWNQPRIAEIQPPSFHPFPSLPPSTPPTGSRGQSRRGERGCGWHAGREAREEGVEEGWIPHGFRTFQWNKARWCQPTCVGWVQRTSKATTPLSTLAFTTFPSILPSRPTSDLRHPLSPFSTLRPLALSPISVPPNPLTTLPVDPICTYVAALARTYALYVPPCTSFTYIHLVHRSRYGIKMDATYASGHRARYERTHICM